MLTLYMTFQHTYACILVGSEWLIYLYHLVITYHFFMLETSIPAPPLLHPCSTPAGSLPQSMGHILGKLTSKHKISYIAKPLIDPEIRCGILQIKNSGWIRRLTHVLPGWGWGDLRRGEASLFLVSIAQSCEKWWKQASSVLPGLKNDVLWWTCAFLEFTLGNTGNRLASC